MGYKSDGKVMKFILYILFTLISLNEESFSTMVFSRSYCDCNQEQFEKYVDTLKRVYQVENSRFIVMKLKFNNDSGIYVFRKRTLLNYLRNKRNFNYYELENYLAEKILHDDSIIIHEDFEFWRHGKFDVGKYIRVKEVEDCVIKGKEYFLNFFFEQTADSLAGKLKKDDPILNNLSSDWQKWVSYRSAITYYLFKWCFYVGTIKGDPGLLYMTYGAPGILKDKMIPPEKFK